MKTTHSVHRAAVLAALAGLCTVPLLRAQTDSFDNYSTGGDMAAAGWILSEMAPGYVTTTFPAVSSGKGLRIQASPIPAQAPAAVIWYRTTEYTNFFMAADLIKWADTNQSVALFARGQIIDDPGGASGYLVNYNVTQQGDAATNPRQGELQISVLVSPFSATQLASAQVTFVAGRSYRITFKGAGHHFTATVYDLFDLTSPLVQLEADDPDAAYDSGVCGIMSFSRNDEIGVTDVTMDNYEIGGSDPSPATIPAISHPVAGTPTIETRVPAERFSGFYDSSAGISFSVKTYTTNVINSAATKFRLNGTDVSSHLVLSANGPAIGGFLAPTALAANSVYSAQIEVQDVSGARKSTNTFWFDTFSESYLASSAVKIIEAEDYNYSNGLYQLEPVPLSGLDLDGVAVAPNGIGYFDKHGVEGVDFHDTVASAEPLWAGEYRMFDAVGLSEGMFPELEDASDPFGDYRYSDYVRSQYATNNMIEVVVHRTAPGEWLNYTRNFAAGNYFAWLRVASFGQTEVLLDKVTSSPTLSGQTTTNLGKFSVPNNSTRYNYRYIPLNDTNNSPVVLRLSGLNTLRLKMSGTAGQDANKLAVNYILFTPAPITVHLLSSSTLRGTYTDEGDAVLDYANRTISTPASGDARFYRLNAEMALTIRSITVSNGTVTIRY